MNIIKIPQGTHQFSDKKIYNSFKCIVAIDDLPEKLKVVVLHYLDINDKFNTMYDMMEEITSTVNADYKHLIDNCGVKREKYAKKTIVTDKNKNNIWMMRNDILYTIIRELQFSTLWATEVGAAIWTNIQFIDNEGVASISYDHLEGR